MTQKLVITRRHGNYRLLLNNYHRGELVSQVYLETLANNETAKKYAHLEARGRKAVGIIFANGKEAQL